MEINILVLGEGPGDRLDGTTMMVEAKYPVNTKKSRKKICLSLHCNASNIFSMPMA